MEVREYAYLGDAVWELYVREIITAKPHRPKELHNLVTSKVKASYQHELLEKIYPDLTEEEKEIVRRARNLSIPISRRNIQKDYRQATAFEAIIGYFYINDKQRLEEIEEKIKNFL